MAQVTAKRVIAGIGLLLAVILGEFYVFSLHFELKARLIRAQFVVIVETVLFIMSRFIWKSICSIWRTTSSCDTQEDNTKSVLATLSWFKRLPLWKKLLLFWFLLSHLSYLTNLFFIGRDPHFISMLCYSALGFEIQLTTGIVLLKVVCWALKKINGCKLDEKRLIHLSFLYAFLATSYGLINAAQPPSIRHVDVPIRDLPALFEGKKIVQLSDIHLGPTVGREKLQQIVDLVGSEDPCMVVITGDLADGKVEELREAVRPLQAIDSVYGGFFVTGNHEYYTGDVDNWMKHLQDIGFDVLHNSNVRLPSTSEHGHICVAGIDDIEADRIGYEGHGMKLESAVASCDPKMPVILLAHQPRAALKALQSHWRIDLVLSGHTHGGQFFPLMVGAYLLNPFFLGLYKYGRSSHVYVSEGTQYWGVPMRIGTWTEITSIRLYRSPN